MTRISSAEKDHGVGSSDHFVNIKWLVSLING